MLDRMSGKAEIPCEFARLSGYNICAAASRLIVVSKPPIERFGTAVKSGQSGLICLLQRPGRQKAGHQSSQTGLNSRRRFRAALTAGSASGLMTLSMKASKSSADNRVAPLSSRSSRFRFRIASTTSDVLVRPVDSAKELRTELSKSLSRRFKVGTMIPVMKIALQHLVYQQMTVAKA